MMGSERRKQFTQTAETVTKAVRSAGSLVVAVLAIACVALVLSAAALTLSLKARPAHG